MKITGIRFERVHTLWMHEGPLAEDRVLRPVDIYPDMRSELPSNPIPAGTKGPPYALQAIYMYIDSDEGVSGFFGTISEEEAGIIKGALAPAIVGENPHGVERIWDRMYRLAIHGRKGQMMMAISKVDIALWDLKARLLGVPVYVLLGGPTRSTNRAYASMLGFSVDPEKAARKAGEVVAQGFTATKWFVRYGPADGEAGIRANIKLIRAVRQAVGPDVGIMFDAWSSWNVPYTQRMAELSAEYGPWWFEEPVLADRIGEYAELRRTVRGVAIAGGEHEYTRWGIKQLLDAGAVDILQPDPTWAGGLTEMRKICALASTYGVPVIPHHGSFASTHLIASQDITTCPIQEWLIQIGWRENAFLKYKLLPDGGAITPPDRPGLGIELDEDAITQREWLDLN